MQKLLIMASLKSALTAQTLPTLVTVCHANRILLIDGDMLVYHACYTQAGTPSVGVAKTKCINLINELLENSQAGKAILMLTAMSSPKCYRSVAGRTFPYQGQKSRGKRPDCWYPIRQWIEMRTDPRVTVKLANYYEADDGMAMFAEQLYKRHQDPTLIWVASKDKDLRMVTGVTHMDWDNSVYTTVPKDAFLVRNSQYPDKPYGLYWFFYQMLAGDTVDNIKGCQGIGEVAAHKILEGCTSVADALPRVQEAYLKRYGSNFLAYFTEVAWLLWLRTVPNYAALPDWLPVDKDYIQSVKDEIQSIKDLVNSLPTPQGVQ